MYEKYKIVLQRQHFKNIDFSYFQGVHGTQ